MASGEVPQSRLSYCAYCVFSIFVVFAVHRALVLPLIASASLHEGYAVRILLTGLASDLWVACAFSALLFWTRRAVLTSFLLILTLLLAGHIPYVEFYHVTLRYAHLAYLADIHFMRASASDSLNPLSYVQWAIGMIVSAVAWRQFRVIRPQKALLWIVTPLLLTGAGIGLNYFSQSKGRRWNLSEHLRNNVIVGLALDAAAERRMALENEISDSDWNIFKTKRPQIADVPFPLQHSNSAVMQRVLAQMQNEGTRPPPDAAHPAESVFSSLRSAFAPEVLKKEPRYFFILLLESTRALESHLYHPEFTGNTAVLDSYARAGILFRRGVSTGSVSRAGAESSACNSLASMTLNAMRNMPLSRPLCVQELLSKKLADLGVQSQFSFVHGGYLSFDRQNEFWHRNGFEVPFNILDLPTSLPRTDWGISDRSYFHLTEEWLGKNEQRTAGLHFALMPTISNHFAWALPSDADDDVRRYSAALPANLQNFASLRYQDHEIGKFVEGLKKQGIWQKSFVVLVGDHGMTEESEEHPDSFYNYDETPQTALKYANAMAGVYFALSGGLVEDAVQKCRREKGCPDTSLEFTHPVSQADILPTLAELLNFKGLPFFGTNLFDGQRRWPVFADVEDAMYFPGDSPAVFSKHKFLRPAELPEEYRAASVYYKLYRSFAADGTLATEVRHELTGEKN